MEEAVNQLKRSLDGEDEDDGKDDKDESGEETDDEDDKKKKRKVVKMIKMKEITEEAVTDAKVTKRRGKKRAVAVENDVDPGHITMALSIARGIKQPPLFFIIGDLTYVPLRVQEMAEAEAFFIFVSKRGFMTKVLFREWCTILINWVLEQKLIGYYAQDEKIILFVDGHPSRRDREAKKLLKKEDIIALTYPVGLTSHMQPLDKVINGPLRTNYRNIFRTVRSKFLKKKQENLNEEDVKLCKEDKREIIIQTSIQAVQQTVTYDNRISSFNETGLYPRDQNVVLNNEDVLQDQENPRYENGRSSLKSPQCSKIITDLSDSDLYQLSDPDYLPEKDPYIYYSDCEESDDGQEFDSEYNESNLKSVKSNKGKSKIEISESSEQEPSSTDSYETNHIEQTDQSDSESNFFDESNNSRSKKPTKEIKEKKKALSDFQLISQIAEENNQSIIDNQAGGDCYFRALSVGLYNTEDEHINIRQLACDYLQNHANDDDIRVQFVTQAEAKIARQQRENRNFNPIPWQQREREETIEQYIIRMRNVHQWADGPVLEAAARVIGRKVTIFLPDKQSYTLNNPILLAPRLNITLAFINNNHYVTFVNNKQ
ncbi:MAG: hypothetical protein EZS28_002162 [Streblomastix strix]|uniref:OTU domain-containing protein n=1 Tax=Streblomastix strix TaxID=222440 RepID=A0A5J4X4T5_9EUKA|nr:MAG: hypothetical protein EZS28_002162 [Streblomastix strix]